MKKTSTKRLGFTLVEVLIASSVMVLVTSGTVGLYVTARKIWYPSTLTMAANIDADRAMSRMVYGVNFSTGGLRSAAQSTVSRWSDGDSWTLTFNTNRWLMYNGVSNTLSSSYAGLLAKNVLSSTCGVSSTGCGIMFRIVESAGMTTVTNRYDTSVTFRN